MWLMFLMGSLWFAYLRASSVFVFVGLAMLVAVPIAALDSRQKRVIRRRFLAERPHAQIGPQR